MMSKNTPETVPQEILQAGATFQYLKDHFEFKHRAEPGLHIMNAAEMAEFLAVLRSPTAKRLYRVREKAPSERVPITYPRTAKTPQDGSTAEAIGLGRAALGWTQGALAVAAGVATQTVHNIENRKSMGRPATVKALRGAMERAGVRFTPEAVSWSPRHVGLAVDPEAKPSEEEWIAEQEAVRSEDDRPPMDGDAPFEPV